MAKRVGIDRHENVNVMQEDFGTLVICAVRYAMGRRSYMPSLVQDIVLQHLKSITDKDLCVLLQDCEKQEMDGLWGDEKIDKPGWIVFRQMLNKEKEDRGII